jgi:hypothetical protein
MQLKIDAVGPQKTSQYGNYFGIKSGNDWYNCAGDRNESLKGKSFEVKVKEKGKFKWAKILKEVTPAQAASGNGHIPWATFVMVAKAAHELALELEPDTEAFDRAPARIDFVQSIIVALREAKIAVPSEDEGAPPFEPEDETGSGIPF